MEFDMLLYRERVQKHLEYVRTLHDGMEAIRKEVAAVLARKKVQNLEDFAALQERYGSYATQLVLRFNRRGRRLVHNSGETVTPQQRFYTETYVPETTDNFQFVQTLCQRYGEAYAAYTALVSELEGKLKRRQDWTPIKTAYDACVESLPTTRAQYSFTLEERPNLAALRRLLKTVTTMDSALKGKLRAYLRAVEEGGSDGLTVRYEQKLYDGKRMGRYYPVGHTPCATNLPSSVRSELFGKKEVDVDIENCAYSILRHLCVTHGFEEEAYVHVCRYIEDREAYMDCIDVSPHDVLKANMARLRGNDTRKIRKRILTSLLYCGATEDPNHVRHEYGDSVKLGPTVLAFYKELTALKRRISALPEYADTIASRKRAHNKKKRFHEGTAVSVVLAEHEAEYVRTAIRYFQSRGFTVSSYAYDGFHVTLKQTGLGEVEHTLQHINKTLPVRFIVKPWPRLLSATHTERIDKLEPAMKFLLPRSSNRRRDARLFQAMKGAIPPEIMQQFTERMTAMQQPSPSPLPSPSPKPKIKKRWGPDPDVLVLDAPPDLMEYLDQLSKETGTAMREPIRERTYKLVMQDKDDEETVLVQGQYVYDVDSRELIGWLNSTTVTIRGEERPLAYLDTPTVEPDVTPYIIPVGLFSLLPAFLTAENRIYLWITPKMAYEVGYLDPTTQQVYLSLAEN